MAMLAASTFNDVGNIVFFSLSSSIALAEAGAGGGSSMEEVLLVIFLEVIGGIGAGIVLGFAMYLIKKTPLWFKAII